MSDIPDTNDIRVAALAAALSLSSVPKDGSKPFFDDRLKRFLTAYRAILTASNTSQENPAVIDVETIIAGQK